jgi:hypothetical protein
MPATAFRFRSVQDGHLTLGIGQLQPPRVAPRLRSLPPRSATDDGIMSDHRSCRHKLTGDGDVAIGSVQLLDSADLAIV